MLLVHVHIEIGSKRYSQCVHTTYVFSINVFFFSLSFNELLSLCQCEKHVEMINVYI